MYMKMALVPKGIRAIHLSCGAGDGNRTRVTSLGSLGNNHYTTPATAHYYTPTFLRSPNNSTKSRCGQVGRGDRRDDLTKKGLDLLLLLLSYPGAIFTKNQLVERVWIPLRHRRDYLENARGPPTSEVRGLQRDSAHPSHVTGGNLQSGHYTFWLNARPHVSTRARSPRRGRT